MTDSIVKHVTVPLRPERAFKVFTDEISDWWPLGRYSLQGKDEEPVKSVHIAPKIGGAVTETRFDGSTAIWGHVTDWQPGKRFAMTWRPSVDDEITTHVELRFDAVADGTRVTLTHSGWGNTAPSMALRSAYSGAWQGIFQIRYARACQAQHQMLRCLPL